jgi:hypothetical protein
MATIAAYGKLSISSVMHTTKLCTVRPAARRCRPPTRTEIVLLNCA